VTALLHNGKTARTRDVPILHSTRTAHFDDEVGVNFSGESVVVVAKDQVSSNLGGEVAILNFKSGIYYGLDAAGARVWNLIQKPQSVAEVQEAILREFDVEPSQFESDLVALLEKLLAEGLIEVRSSPQERVMA